MPIESVNSDFLAPIRTLEVKPNYVNSTENTGAPSASAPPARALGFGRRLTVGRVDCSAKDNKNRLKSKNRRLCIYNGEQEKTRNLKIRIFFEKKIGNKEL
jgi:hypothetical protein